MSENFIEGISKEAITLALKVSAPMLIIAILIGLIISIIQATTQIQEQTLTFVPKLLGIAVVGIILGGWMSRNLISFTTRIFELIANINI